jgi:hypothetical protein
VAGYVQVANLALQKIGADDQLTDPSDPTPAAQAIAAAWEPIRRAVLRKGKFNFSLTRAELTAQASSSPGYRTPYPFEYRFPLPSDFLRFVEVLGPSSVIDRYKLERGAVLADSIGPVFVRYVADVEDAAEWDDLFVEAFAARLAFQVADRVTGDRGRKSDCWAEYRAAIRETAGVDAKEDPPEEAQDSSWITARFG